MLVENDQVLSEQKEVACTFNEYFGSIIEKLNLFTWPEPPLTEGNQINMIDKIILKYNSHPSIKMLKRHFDNSSVKFSFKLVSLQEVREIIKNLDDKSLLLVRYLQNC